MSSQPINSVSHSARMWQQGALSASARPPLERPDNVDSLVWRLSSVEERRGIVAQQQLQSEVLPDLVAIAADDDAFAGIIRTAFGDGLDPAAVESLRRDLLDGSFVPPRIAMSDAKSLGGASGAYHTGADAIYLDEALAGTAEGRMTLAEELGHALDARLRGADPAADSSGDEGAIFATMLVDGKIDPASLAALRAENDHGEIRVDGRTLQVEFRLPEEDQLAIRRASHGTKRQLEDENVTPPRPTSSGQSPAGQSARQIAEADAQADTWRPQPAPLDEGDAVLILADHWDDINGRDHITSRADFDKLLIAENTDTTLRAAIQYFIDHPAAFDRLDTADDGGDTDTKASTNDVVAFGANAISEEDALRIMVGELDSWNGGDDITSLGDLERLARNQTNTPEQRMAAAYYVAHPEEFAALETAWNGVSDDKASNRDVRIRMEQIQSEPPPIQQLSTHNSYEQGDTLTEQFERYGITSFELDIHDNDDGLLGAGLWDVRHFGRDDSAGSLNTYLDEIAALETDEPITVFIDLKSDLGSEGHSADELDALIDEKFGDRLYTPRELMAEQADGTSLQSAVQNGAWPDEAELGGRIIVVLTDDGRVGDYVSGERSTGVDANAFIAPKPVIENGEFVPQSNAVIYNVDADPFGSAFQADERDDIAQINQLVTGSGNLVRNYNISGDNVDQLAASGANWLATDHYADLSEVLDPRAQALLATGNYDDHFTRGADLDLVQVEADADAFNGQDNHIVLQSIFDPVVANKPTTIDEYSVVVELPEGVDPADVMTSMAGDMDGLLQGEFAELGDFKNQGDTPRVGQVIDIDVKDGPRIPWLGWQVGSSPFNAPVVISSIDDTSFSVQTIEYNNVEHLLHGTREWGYEALEDGTVRFYTRGVSVEDTQAAEGIPGLGNAKDGERRFWTAWVDGVERHVTDDLGGEVVDGSRIIVQSSGPTGSALWDQLSPTEQQSVADAQIHGHEREAAHLDTARDRLIASVADIPSIDDVPGYDDVAEAIASGDVDDILSGLRDLHQDNDELDGRQGRAVDAVESLFGDIRTLQQLAAEHRTEVEGWHSFVEE